jgi:membrane protein
MKSVWSTTKRVWAIWSKSDIYRLAASLVLTSALSMIPLFTVVLGFSEMLGGLDKALTKVEPLVFQYLAPGTAPDFVNNIQASIDRSRGKAVGLVSIFFLIYTVTRLLLEIDTAFSIIVGRENTRAMGRGLIFSWMVLLAGPIVIAGMMILSKFVNPMMQKLISGLILAGGFGLVWTMFRISFARNISWKIVSLSSLVCISGVFLSEKIYVWCTKSIFNYNEIYGSLAFLPLFLMWLLVFWNIVLLSMVFGRILIENSKAPQTA